MLMLCVRLSVLRFKTVIKCTVGVTEELKVKLGLRHLSALSYFFSTSERWNSTEIYKDNDVYWGPFDLQWEQAGSKGKCMMYYI